MALMNSFRASMLLCNQVMTSLFCVTLFSIGSASAFAQSQLFVIVDSDSQLSDIQEQAVHVQVPVHLLNVNRIGDLGAEVESELAFVEGLSRDQVIARGAEIQAAGQNAVNQRLGRIQTAYSEAVVAGEISTRYGINDTPSLVEIDSLGNYRFVTSPVSFQEGIVSLDAMGFIAAPPALGGGATVVRNARAAPARTTRAVPGPRETEYSVLDSILDGSSSKAFDCIDARISGLCTYLVVRVYCTPFGCSVETTPEASLEITHNNPELLIASYKRLGASPLTEARALFGDLQNAISGPGIEVLTGENVPDDYDDPDRWAAYGTEQSTETEPATMKFHEIDVIGHAGTLFSYLHADDLNPIPPFTAHILEAPNNLLAGITASGGQVASSMSNAANTVTSAASGIPNRGPVMSGGAGSFTGQTQMPSGAEILESAEGMFPAGMAAAAGQFLGLSDTFTNLLGVWQSSSATDLQDIVSDVQDLADPSSGLGGLDQYSDQVTQITDLIQGAGGGFDGLGLGAGGTEMWSFCPSGARFMQPYLLSGLDMVQWKFNIPEIVYPQTYAPPLPFFADKYVGNLSFIGANGLQVPNAWGPIYPRQGFIAQPDEMKASAIAAARGAHVVTRPGQPHVYSLLAHGSREHLDITYPPPYAPNDKVSGKWQQLAPDLDDKCYVFSEDDLPLLPWTRNRAGLDRNHVFAFWRESACCPTPRKGSAVTMVVTGLGTISLDIPLIN